VIESPRGVNKRGACHGRLPLKALFRICSDAHDPSLANGATIIATMVVLKLSRIANLTIADSEPRSYRKAISHYSRRQSTSKMQC
jgi:hypothetical protein